MDRRKILQGILAGRVSPDAIPGKGCLIITPGTNGLVNCDGRQMDATQAKRAIRKAETILFYEGEDSENELFNQLSSDVDFEIDFNCADNDLDI